jgi:hypothetical protein
VLPRHGKGVVALVSVADADFLERLERLKEKEDVAILSERLQDADASEHIPHAQIEAEINRDPNRRGPS